MGFLLFLLVIATVLYFMSHRQSPNTAVSVLDQKLEERNYEWAQFIAQYYVSAQTPKERKLIEQMLADIAARELPVPALPGLAASESEPAVVGGEQVAAQTASIPAEAETMPVAQASVAHYQPQNQASSYQVQLDNASLLLYFGAFLFVASAGLFVAFGDLPGALRTAIVLLIAIVLYAGGMYLVERRAALRQAGLAFVGIGMAVMPLTGLAAYNYIFNQSNANLVWFVTSLLCVGLYAHALVRLREPLISYVFIFTLLSLFESGVSIINAPLYYYGWAMAVVGIGFSAYSRSTRAMPELRESSRAGAMLFVPLAVVVSLALLPGQGVAQLGVSLLVAALYYAMEAMFAKDDADTQQLYAVVAQVAGLAGIGSLAYAVWESWPVVAVVVLGFGVIQLCMVLLKPAVSELWQNFASVMLASQTVAVVMAYEKPALMLAVMAGLVCVAGLTAVRQRRADAYSIAALAWMAIPFVYGWMFMNPRIDTAYLNWLLIGALSVQLAIYILVIGRLKNDEWKLAGQSVYIVSAIAPIMVSFFAPAWLCFCTCAVVSLSMVLLAQFEKETDWGIGAGLVASLPLLLALGAHDDQRVLLATNLFALILNMGMSLWLHLEANRWFSTILWLLLPVTLGSGVLGSTWTAAEYAWAYFVAMLGLVLSRAIARGVVLPSNHVPMASYARTASLSYVVGYAFAAGASLVISLTCDTSQLHTTLLLGGLTLTIVLLSEVIEKRADLLALVPFGLQAMLWSSVRPGGVAFDIEAYLLMSSLLAVACYIAPLLSTITTEKQYFIRTGALLTAFIAPAYWVITDRTYWPMPLGLGIASGLLYYQVRQTSQQIRELVGGLALIAIYWAMAFAGVEAAQAYTHLLVALLAGYAYWRHIRGEIAQSDQYIIAALAVATIPLALQALSSVAGGLYGWWLLLEQVVFMLIGMIIGKSFVVRWGLYVAVAAVLYQLRHLGWAALTLLALFLIGLAIQRLLSIDAKKKQ